MWQTALLAEQAAEYRGAPDALVTEVVVEHHVNVLCLFCQPAYRRDELPQFPFLILIVEAL